MQVKVENIPKRVSKILFVDTMNIKNKTYITLNYILSKCQFDKCVKSVLSFLLNKNTVYKTVIVIYNKNKYGKLYWTPNSRFY
jgi:hypothetical protein